MKDLEKLLISDGYKKIQLEEVSTGHLQCSGFINGIEAKFVLDTAASSNVLDIEVKEKFSITSDKTDEFAGGAGSSEITMEKSKSNILKLADFESNNVDLTLISLEHVNKSFEKADVAKTDGLIGADLLTKHQAIIDYSNFALYLK